MVNKFKNLLARFVGGAIISPTSTVTNTNSPTSSGNASNVVGIVHSTVPAPNPLPKTEPAISTLISSPTISIMNASSVLTDDQVKKAVIALQTQLDRDFAPVWGLNASLQFLDKTVTPPIHHWLLTVLDTSDQPGALGYHDLTDEGLPIAKIFAKDDIKYGLSWSVTLSHELMEMIVDPYIANCVFAQSSNTTGILYAYEVCDPCESDELAYKINDILVSDFVYPSWFEGFRKPGSTKFDFMGSIDRPFHLAKGGYISQFIVGPGSQGWDQITAARAPTVRNKKGENSRAVRRRTSRKPKEVIVNTLKD